MSITFKTFSLKDIGKLLISIAISEGVGLLSVVLTPDIRQVYQGLVKPPFSPPGWVFAPVWVVLYLLMGIASYRIWELGPKNKLIEDALTLYSIQLSLNLLWTLLFFGLCLRGAAFMEILVLLIFVTMTAVRFYRLDKQAGYLMIPYVLWVAFAAVLNVSIWYLNR